MARSKKPLEITSLNHEQVKRYAKLIRDNAYRKKEKAVVVEGKKLVLELLEKGKIKSLMIVNEEDLPKNFEGNCYLITQAILKKISQTITPEGIMAEVHLDEVMPSANCQRLLILDRVSDPGNMGALIRTAAGLNWDAVFLLTGSCDPFNDKALRASKGAVFNMPLISGSLSELLDFLEKKKFAVYIADFNGISPDDISLNGKEPLALILGNEAQGVAPTLRKLFKQVTIPISRAVESLNAAAAGAILMYSLRKI